MLDIRNCDCLEMIKTFKDKEFDLACIDPPYGIDVNKMMLGSGKYMSDKKWDISAPSPEFFRELFRVSKNQIIWGANHFSQKIANGMLLQWMDENEDSDPSEIINYIFTKFSGLDTSCWLVWDKNNGTSDFADAELAWTSFENPVRLYTFNLVQQKQSDIKNRFHPTQKPVQLYKWIFEKFTTKGMKVLDTHLGSGSIAIAAHEYELDLMASEIDKEYYEKAMKRIKDNTIQNSLF